MGDEIFSVYLTPADYSKLAYAKLDLPASPWKLLDALDKVRLPEGDSLYLEITDYRDFEVLRSSLVCSATNLLELNDLAERLSRLNEVQRIAFEGLVRVDFQKQESITLKRLRDLAESVDCCHVVESVVSDGQLGRFYAENGFVPEVEGMSDAAFELLDFEKVGKMARMGECGVYVPSGISGLGGYVVQHSDLKSAPEITLNQPVEPAYTIHLRLTAHHDTKPKTRPKSPLIRNSAVRSWNPGLHGADSCLAGKKASMSAFPTRAFASVTARRSYSPAESGSSSPVR